jgi:hypothetical protein
MTVKELQSQRVATETPATLLATQAKLTRYGYRFSGRTYRHRYSGMDECGVIQALAEAPAVLTHFAEMRPGTFPMPDSGGPRTVHGTPAFAWMWRRDRGLMAGLDGGAGPFSQVTADTLPKCPSNDWSAGWCKEAVK